MLKKFPHYRQLDAMDCGPTCLRIIAKYYGKSYSLQTLRDKSYITREGVSLLGISDAAESIGFRTLAAKIPYDKLKEEAPTPFIAHWRQQHFIVVYGFKKNHVLVSDPAHGLVKLTKKEFLDGWLSDTDNGQEIGVVLLLEPAPDFYTTEDEKVNKSGFQFLFKYLRPYKKFIVQLFIGMLVGSILQLIFPFLTQSIVDIGIQNQDLNFVTLILIAQLMLFFSRTAVEFIRGWILLHLGTRINISILSDFLIKLMRLPVSFFDTKMIGDLLQRIGDHSRIESFLTSSTLNILFSFINLIIFGVVLAIYDLKIFAIFFIGSAIYMAWIMIFMKKRRDLDYKRFDQMSSNQSNLIQLITGMQEIKLHNSEKQKRWEWERIQAKLFRVSISGLALNQYQEAGSSFINELKNIVITFLAAKAVIDGDITLGMMLAIQYIIGQLNAPINQLVGFIHTAQDAKISLERLGEIHGREDEEDLSEEKITIFPEDKSLKLDNVTFQYEGPHSEYALRDISLEIPEGKVTAIVGASGSGKTTLVKLLLKFYEPSQGEIRLGDINLNNYSNRLWRDKCGAVLQDGFIFSDTIAKNISIKDDYINKEKLMYAVKVANIQEFIESLPLGYNTKIGNDGHGLSQGQKQRILIARAVYKSPEYIFFDEATNALDANNEKVIMENLDRFFVGRTVIVVAHRLSTVKNADQIIVLDKGHITEIGTHAELTEKRGDYYRLVKNQLELGN
ncbi:peptidase domain-containing ABC transporter [Fulvivirga kasyanovii]|uniref:Peptidase domain-containing ABC transporter n=1 Tax=Fulvivirga kasyanovii TaxID=396812 RepID=A0ABW9RM00_9BACT|nr:peptidase domain-containing ABC transporter [Fulvivirga kasyanovii]MTI25148.1 peptidase domain-containing ABC transporter [Fulvivirga kasyanovii]